MTVKQHIGGQVTVDWQDCRDKRKQNYVDSR